MTCFGEVAARLCGLTSNLLGWRPDEFWNSTPAELALAVQEPDNPGEPVDPSLIDQLRRRFPDE